MRIGSPGQFHLAIEKGLNGVDHLSSLPSWDLWVSAYPVENHILRLTPSTGPKPPDMGAVSGIAANEIHLEFSKVRLAGLCHPCSER